MDYDTSRQWKVTMLVSPFPPLPVHVRATTFLKGEKVGELISTT